MNNKIRIVFASKPQLYVLCFLIYWAFSTFAAHAQDCEPLLPCGPIPWQLPSFPDLRSPTPFPTIEIVATGGTITPTATPTITTTPTPLPTVTPMPTFTPFPTFTPYPTFTPLPTWTPFMDVSDLEDTIGTLNAMVNATAIPITDFDGTPIGMNTVTDLAGDTSTIFGYARGLTDVNFGVLSPLMVLMFTAMFIFVFLRVLTFLLPLLMALFGFIRKIVELILGFIPG